MARRAGRGLESASTATALLAQAQAPPAAVQPIRLPPAGIGVLPESLHYYPNRELAAHVLGFEGVDDRGLEGVELAHDRLLAGDAGLALIERDALGRDVGAQPRILKTPRPGRGWPWPSTRASSTWPSASWMIGARRGPSPAWFSPWSRAPATSWPWRSGHLQPQRLPGGDLGAVAEPRGHRPVRAGLHVQGDPGGGRARGGGGLARGPVLRRAGRHHHREPDDPRLEALRVALLPRGSQVLVERRLDQDRPRARARAVLQARHRIRVRRPHRVGLPGESRGQLRPPHRWSGLSLASMSIGQEISVTGLQILSAFAAIANDGVLMQPRMVRAILDAEGREVRRLPPQAVRQVISAATAARLREILAAVVAEGTGQRASVPGYSVGGKTGTAQTRPRHARLFSQARGPLVRGVRARRRAPAGHAGAAREPKTVAWGSEVAAPLFAAVAAPALRYLGVPPANQPSVPLIRTAAAPAAEPATSPTVAPLFAPETGEPTMPDLAGRACARRWRSWPATTWTWPSWAGGWWSARLRRLARRSRPGMSAGSSWCRRGPPVVTSMLAPRGPRRAPGGAAGADRGGPPAGFGPGADRRLPARDRGRLLRGRPRSPGGRAPLHPPGRRAGGPPIVAEPPDPLPDRPVGRILVPDTRRALPRLADAYFGHPSRALTVVGITGTNGKTTTSYLVEALLRAPRARDGVVGTIQFVVRGVRAAAGQTTPEALELHGLLAEMRGRRRRGRDGGVVARPRPATRRRRRLRRRRSSPT